jgi:large subunit ribosomal protein L31
MRAAIQPKLNEIKATCACGAEYELLSTVETLRLDICANCHPFFTGQQRFVDTEGRIDKFRTKFGTNAAEALRARAKAKKGKVETAPKVTSVAAEVTED